MNAPTSPVTENVADLDSGITENEFPNGDDLAISRATDFYNLDELLTDQEREMRDRVRRWCDTEVAPAAAGYWERAEFPVELAKGYGRHRRRLDRRGRLPRGVVSRRRCNRGRTGPRRMAASPP
jgi:glutaryl-CoA dehydrogenase